MAAGLVRRVWARLALPSSGAACAVVTAVLCGLGGVLFELVPDYYRYRLYGSWSAPRWHTAWVLALLAVTAIWCVHAAVWLFRSPRVAVAIAQLGGVLAFGTYAWLVLAAPAESFAVTDQSLDIYGERYRALRVEPGRDGRPAAAVIERRRGGAADELRVERGSSWVSADAAHRLVLARAGVAADGAILRRGQGQVELPAAQLPTPMPVDPEWAGENAFLGVKESPVLLVRVYPRLGVRLGALAAALLLGAGVLFWQGRRARSHVK